MTRLELNGGDSIVINTALKGGTLLEIRKHGLISSSVFLNPAQVKQLIRDLEFNLKR
jgi:hypothetical protein